MLVYVQLEIIACVCVSGLAFSDFNFEIAGKQSTVIYKLT